MVNRFHGLLDVAGRHLLEKGYYHSEVPPALEKDN